MTTSTIRLRRRMRRYTTVTAWAAVIVVALMGWFLWNNNPGFHAAVIGMLPPEVALTYVPNPTATNSATPTLLPETTPTATGEPTNTPIVTVTATPLGGGRGQLAFVSDRNGGIPQVWLMDGNGAIIRQVTNEPEGACQPDWSPDGMRIVYVSPCRQKLDTYSGSSLYIINADGSDRFALPTSLGGNFEPAWSPDGKRIAFTSLRDGYHEIYMINLDTLTAPAMRLTKSAASISGAIYARMPAWSPFGSQIAFVLKRAGRSQIWVTTDSDANIPKPYEQLVNSGNTFSDFLPAWTPDGQFVVFNQTNINSDVEPPAYLMSIRYEDRASKQAVLLPIEPLPIVDVDFSPDGFWMAFESWPEAPVNQDIYIATITGANRTRLTTDPAFDFDPVWRPFIPETAP